MSRKPILQPLDRPEAFPGRSRVTWRREPFWGVLAALTGAMWPPIPITLLVWPPSNWIPSLEIDPRLAVLAIGLVAVPACLWAIQRERRRMGRPATRLGIVWRFMFYGGLLAAALEAVFALVLTVFGWFEANSLGEAAGATETTLLVYGVGGIPVAVLVGVSYALWAGLCAAFIAFRTQPEVRDRLGLMQDEAG